LWGGPGPAKQNVSVIVPVGASLSRAAAELEKAGAIRSSGRFLLFAKVLGGGEAIKAGEYSVPARLSQADVLKLLQSGKTLQRQVTIPEGTPSILVYEALRNAPHLTGDVAVPAEGTILPDSYAYNRGDTRRSVLDRMQKAMSDYLAKAWQKRKPGIAVKTPLEAVTLASIVEKETGKDDERAHVASVFINRLNKGMRLQSDPTIVYGIFGGEGKPSDRPIYKSDLTKQTPYNTYQIKGLPPTPISNPGRAALEAVANPWRTNDLYFVADGTGGHVFAATLEEHNANVRRWRRIEAERSTGNAAARGEEVVDGQPDGDDAEKPPKSN